MNIQPSRAAIYLVKTDCLSTIYLKLIVPILRLMHSHFEMEIDNLPLRLKKPYVYRLIEELVRLQCVDRPNATPIGQDRKFRDLRVLL